MSPLIKGGRDEGAADMDTSKHPIIKRWIIIKKFTNIKVKGKL
jgi:hypothetical protein